jgi:uncharacterized repeat protein (TIGR03803 family)
MYRLVRTPCRPRTSFITTRGIPVVWSSELIRSIAPWTGSRFAAVLVFATCCVAQTATSDFATLYNFTGTSEGGLPQAPVVVGASGELYGTTFLDGTQGFGTVFSLTPPSYANATWTESVLFNFNGTDGAYPHAGLVIGPGGELYGTTEDGGAYNFGTVFALIPPSSPGGRWLETVLYSFTGGNDGAYPYGGLIRGGKGALYGTTYNGGTNNLGVVFQLIPPSSTSSLWTENVLHTFGGPGDGTLPFSGLTYSRGLLCGTTSGGGAYGYGTIFSLAPPISAGGAWTETVNYSFTGASDGAYPMAGLEAGAGGVLYGATFSGGTGGGTVFSLTPPVSTGTPWALSVLYTFNTLSLPSGSLLFIPGSGTLYGTTSFAGINDDGTIFELRPPTVSGGTWTYKVIYSFTGANGADPEAGLVLGGNGILYGTTGGGGTALAGTVFALTTHLE